ncbi:GldL-related protein [Sunxiuqinia sp. sy24]|uniref:GldL-related protein n=1 Tax=Sunxiuqinia sp. sy24 TaxID=3461495 RepID=UPI004045C7CC
MTREQTDSLMGMLLNTSVALVLIGAFFKLQHYPYGNLILWTGFISGLLIQSFEIKRLKRIIKKLENNEQEPE